MKRLVWCALVCGLLAAVYFGARALSGENHSASVRRISAVWAIPGRPRTIKIEVRAGVCNSKEARRQGGPISVKREHDREIYLTVPSSEHASRYCLGQEVASVRYLTLSEPVSRFTFFDAGTSPPTRLQVLSSPDRPSLTH